MADHILSYQVAGTLITNDGNQKQVFREGDLWLSKRNHLVKFRKEPPAHGEFKSFSIILGQGMLRGFSLEYGYHADQHLPPGNAAVALPMNPLYKSYFESLQPTSSSPGPATKACFP